VIELTDDEPPAVGRAVNGNSVVVGGAGGSVGATTGVSGSMPEQHPNISPSSVGQQFPSNSLSRHDSYAEHSATTGGAGTPPSVGFALGAGRPLMVGLGVGFAVGEGVVSGQSVSKLRIHSSSEAHQLYPALDLQPFSSRSLPGAGRFTGAPVGDRVGPLVGDVVGEGVGSLVGDFVGEGVVVPGQTVSHDLIHSSSGSHHEYPADGMQPFSSRSLPGAGRFTGASVGDEVGSGATHR